MGSSGSKEKSKKKKDKEKIYKEPEENQRNLKHEIRDGIASH